MSGTQYFVVQGLNRICKHTVADDLTGKDGMQTSSIDDALIAKNDRVVLYDDGRIGDAAIGAFVRQTGATVVLVSDVYTYLEKRHN